MRGSANKVWEVGTNIQSTLGVRNRRSKRSRITILNLKMSCAGNCRTTSSRISVGKSRRVSGGLPAVIQGRALSVTPDGRTNGDLTLCVKFAILLNGFGIRAFRNKGALPPTAFAHLPHKLVMRGYSRSCTGA